MDIEVQNKFQVLMVRIKGEFFDLDSRRKGNGSCGAKSNKVTGSEP